MTETLVFNFGERKTFVVDGEKIGTDNFGHLEVDPDSFIVGLVVASAYPADDLYNAVRRFLLAHQREVEAYDW